MPTRDFGSELRSYTEQRYQRGFLLNTVPMGCYVGTFGAFYAFYVSRRGQRHVPLKDLLGRYTLSFFALGWGTSAVHQGLLYLSDYRSMPWQPAISGALGGFGFAMLMHGNPAASAQAGGVVAMLYTFGFLGTEWWRDRSLRDFFHTAQQGSTPIAKITPELQPTYRAFLYDNRPMEEDDMEMRRVKLRARKENDTRLDAKTHIEAMQSGLWGLTFPEWWPLKFGETNPESIEALARARAKEDEIQRRKKMIQESGDDSYFSQGFMTRQEVRSTSLPQDGGTASGGPTFQPKK